MGEPLKSEFWDFWSEWWLEITDPMTDLMTNQINLGDQTDLSDQTNHSHEMEYKRDSERTIAMHNAMHPWHGMSHICPFTPIYEGKGLLETISSLQTRTRCSVEIAYNLLGKILLLVLVKILKWRTLYGAVYPNWLYLFVHLDPTFDSKLRIQLFPLYYNQNCME